MVTDKEDNSAEAFSDMAPTKSKKNKGKHAHNEAGVFYLLKYLT